MKNIKQTIVMGLLASISIIGCTDKKDIPAVSPAVYVTDRNWQFETTPVWQDDFNTGTAPDATKWSYDIGGSGWGNNELQNYTNGNNASIVGGNLVITAKKESLGGSAYTSTRMVTKGKGDWLYGRFEARAKLPKGRGTWPAIWMLSSDDEYGIWPASGEVDIMEHVGFDPNNIHFTIHTALYNGARGTQKSSAKVVPGAIDDFHTYRVDWTPFAVRGYIDDVSYFEYTNDNTGFSTWPFNKKFHLLLNIAIGGNWGGAQGIDDTVFPATMLVDYVKVYKLIP